MERVPIMRPSLLAQYIQEGKGKSTLESDKGFAIYSFVNDGCYIEEIFILKEYRKTGEASRLTDQIVEIARQKGCKKLLGSIIPSTSVATNSIRAMIAYGFKVTGSISNFIYLEKDL